MSDYYKNTPLPIYNAIFYNGFEYYVDIIKLQDYMITEDNQCYNLASVIDIDINNMNNFSNLFFINTLNNTDIIINQLEKFSNYIDKENITTLKTLNKVLSSIENLLKKIDFIFSKILIFEIRSQFFKQQDELKLMNVSLQEAIKEDFPYSKEYILTLNEHIEETKNYNKMIKSKLQKVIALLRNANQYTNMYYGIENSSSPCVNFLSKSMFNFSIPKHYIRPCIINDNKIMESIEAWCHAIKDKSLTRNLFDNKLYNVEVYEIHSISDYINVSLNHLLNNYDTLKKCNNCNNYFIPESRTDEVYCNRISPQNPNKTCKEYGAKKTYRDEIKSTPIKYEHNKTSQYFRMRIKRAKIQKEKTLYEKKFNRYKENYQKKKQKYQSHRLEEADFVEWIKKQKDLQQ